MISKKGMNSLERFEFWVNGADFEDLYCKLGGDENIAKHLWNKFIVYDHSILRLWTVLDKNNRDMMIGVINEWLKENPK